MSASRSFLLNSPRQSPFQNKRSRQLLQREDTLNISPILNETSIFRTLNDTSLRQALDESSIIGNAGHAGDSLDEAFFEIIQTSHQSDILDTLARLAQACLDNLELVEPWNRYNAQNYWLAEEANTWKLLHSLYADTIKSHPQTLDTLPLETLSQKTLVDCLYQSNVEVRLFQLLVDWLETCAAYQEESTNISAPVIANSIHWSNTLHEVVIGSSLFNKEKNVPMITCMDPDAPRRQKKSIHSDDQQDDNDLCKRIFTGVRCGKFNEALSLCISAGQPWRAAVLQGWRLLHYLKKDDSNANLEIEGNPSRDLWKWSCLGIANNSSENIHYRATIGILCGHLPSTIPACQGNWKDLLWAHLKVQVETRMTKFLHEHHSTAYASTTSSDVLEMLESEFHTEVLTLEQVFSAVNALMDGKKESQYQKCQKHLMLGRIRAIMQESLEWIETAEEKLVRFLAHLVLVLRQVGKDPEHDIGDIILQKYVSQLIEKLSCGLTIDCPDLVAYYTSTLPTPNQIDLYADLLDCVNKSEYRDSVVKAGLKAGVDVAAAARVAIKKAISAIHQGYGNIDMTLTHTGTAEMDKALIEKVVSSLEWLALLPNQLEEALWLGNAMIRTFIFLGNTGAASSIIYKLNKLFPKFAKKMSSKSAEIREHVCLKAYLESLEEFATWHRHFISGQPKDVEPLPADATFSDKVLHEQRCEQLEQQKARWETETSNLSRHTKTLLYNILLFPGGWLHDENDSTSSSNFTDDDKKERTKQLHTLRHLCIPEVTLLIVKILQSGKDVESHKEVVKLSNIIAAENRCLYKVFAKDKLLEVLDRIKESSFVLLEKERDMFGFEIED